MNIHGNMEVKFVFLRALGAQVIVGAQMVELPTCNNIRQYQHVSWSCQAKIQVST